MVDLLRLRSGDTRWRIGMINGPNMPNLDQRDPMDYGGTTIAQLDARVAELAGWLGVELTESLWTNYEGEILTWIHTKHRDLDGILINPAGLTLYGESTRRALEETGLPVVEVHFASQRGRPAGSIFATSVLATVKGFRKHSYTGALIGLVAALDDGDFLTPVRYPARVDAGLSKPQGQGRP
ncbi:MAG: 3-dehydroquinate dehydratase [Microbacteriaceae bacterium]|nr:3-dehydroquinate dehydratase [Microbacteriaceae bacterium]